MTLRVAPHAGGGADWDGFVRDQRGWTHFHLWGWRIIMERVFGHTCLYLGARDDAGRLAAVLPLVRVRSRVFGHYLVSMPFLNHGGPLGSENGVVAVAAEAVRLTREGGARLLELRSRAPLPLELDVSHRKVGVLLDLPPGDPEQLWKALPSKVRSQVRRPMKEGVTVRFGPDQIDPLFQVFSRHMRDLGTPTLPKRLFREIAEVFGDDVWFGCAYLGDAPVACGCAIRWNGEIEMTWASALSEFNRIAPNMLLYWKFMERASTEGIRVFNFGRSTPGAGTHRFKRQWGSRDETLWWYQQAAAGTTGTPSPDDGAYAWGPRAWRRLPLPVATLIGPQIVKYIP